jgi:hypothetical protein
MEFPVFTSIPSTMKIVAVMYLYTLPPALIIAAIVHALWPVQAYHDGCPSCSYSLVGNVTGVCPECGDDVGKQT